MMSVKSSNPNPGNETVVRAGYLKKLKTCKKKFFVLRAEGPESSARLEYYDAEKKFINGQAPKRCIPLKTCFNINKRVDTKHKHVIALYTKDDCFCIGLESEEELDAWLKALLSLQHGEEAADGETPRPTFEHVWQVTLLSRGLGGTGAFGYYPKGQESPVFRLCLTDKTLSLIPKNAEEPQAGLALSSIRSCGSLKNYFYLEVGRSSVTGAGEIWMDTDDTNIAMNVHQTVFHAMATNLTANKEELSPKSRNRSSSATESSKPIGVSRRQTMSGNTKFHQAQDANPQVNENAVPASSSSTHIAVAVSWVTCMYQHLYHRSASKASSQRRHSISAGGVPWPRIVNHQRTQSLPLEHPAPLTDHPIQPPRAAKRSNQSFRCAAGNGRERCDSMPSRARTTSEGGTHPIHPWSQPPRSYLTPHRPQSLCVRDMSHSPPAESPVSPPSAACSTDSAGSSISIDDAEQWAEADTHLGRYSHSLTPDEAIAEENYDDCPDSPYLPQGASPSGYIPMAPISSDDGYVDMSPRGRHTNMSPAASTSSITSGTPSTDMRFAEYPLEKVSAYFTPSEEEASASERPIRAYSVGSRPETRKTKPRFEVVTASVIDNARARAFSVGSKSRKIHTRVLPPHTSSHVHPKPKSSSAPLLSSSRTIASHNSDDLMEMDFSRTPNSGYIDMNPTNRVTGYVEMRPGFQDLNQNSEVSPYVDMRSGNGSSPARQSVMGPPQSDYIPIHRNAQEYVDMESANTRNRNNKYPSGPTTGWPQTEYMDMNFQARNNRLNYSTSPNINDESPLETSMDYMDMGYQNGSSRNHLKPKNTSTKEGYVEMSLGRQNSNHYRQSSFENNRTLSDSNDDYTNMSVGSAKDKKTNKNEKVRSQPIQIQNTSSQFPKSSGSSISPVYSSLHIGRKYSTGTPPKMYTPFSSSGSDSYSSLPRQRTRKNSRRDSNNSSSSSVTTPSSSSTIFPLSLNSPSSPMKTESVSGLKIPAAIINVKYNKKSNNNPDYTVMDFDKPKVESDYVNYNPVKCNRVEQSHDYAIMRPGSLDITKSSELKAKVPVSSPTLTTQLSSMVLGRTCLNLDINGARCFIPISESREDGRYGAMSPKHGDLAPVKPGDGMRNIEESDYMHDSCQSPVAKISRPNSVNSDTSVQKINSRPGSVSCELVKSSLSRPSSASSELGSSSSTIVGSRPDSVNSDRTRPSSINIEGQLHYASLDLATACEEDDNKSPRTVNKSNESTNTSPNQVVVLPESGFNYAEIDFVRSSEGFKHLPSNAKVKH